MKGVTVLFGIPSGVSFPAGSTDSVNCAADPYCDVFANTNGSVSEGKTWNPDTCYSDDDLAVPVKHFIADCVQQCIMGLPSQALAAVVIKFAMILGNEVDKEFADKGALSLEEVCKMVIQYQYFH